MFSIKHIIHHNLQFLAFNLIHNMMETIETHIHYKETDRKQYLLFMSCHPHYTKVNIPFSLSCSVVSDEVKLMQSCNELNKIHLKQKYPEQLIDLWITRALEVDKETLKKTVQLKIENNIPYVLT